MTFIQTMDEASFWFGVVCSLWVCVMLGMTWSIICFWREDRATRRAEEEALKYGRHSESSQTRENASAVTEVISDPTETSRSDRPGRTETAILPETELYPGTRGARVTWHKQ